MALKFTNWLIILFLWPMASMPELLRKMMVLGRPSFPAVELVLSPSCPNDTVADTMGEGRGCPTAISIEIQASQGGELLVHTGYLVIPYTLLNVSSECNLPYRNPSFQDLSKSTSVYRQIILTWDLKLFKKNKRKEKLGRSCIALIRLGFLLLYFPI